MRISAVGAGTFGQAGRHAPRTDLPAHEPAAASRALVVVEAPEPTQDRPMAYRNAPFLAQLIATKDKLPQTRSRRRAEPAEAVAIYRAVAKLVA
jgi:hypothetical protein